MKRYKRKFKKFTEELRLSDLANNSGISDLTKNFRSIRNKRLGSESRSAKLVDVKINKDEDYIDFAFITVVTPYPDDPNYTYGETDPPDWEIEPNTGNNYEMIIRVLDFFKWLETTPDQITNKDIEDVIKVAYVKLSCNCPSFNWQGFDYHLTTFDAAIYPQTIPDPVWGPRHNNGDSLICKHLSGLVANIKFFIPQMRQMIKKAVS